jgi:dTDP-4-amino-4,6-dideoxygalactose transaminase
VADRPQKIFDGPFPWPMVDVDVREVLLTAWRDGSWGHYHADHTSRLEERLRQHFSLPHVMLCCSGTVAVELALRGGKIGPGDEVILAAYDFPGNFRAIEAVGARPVLIDVAAGSWTIDLNQFESGIGPQTKGLIVSHLHGTLADMPAIMEIARRRGLFVVEDACQMHGGSIAGKPAGSWGDAGILSFGGSKLVTAGRGGAVLSSQADVQQRMTIYAERGNETFPISQLQAAVLNPQWDKLAERNRFRAQQVARLIAMTNDLTAFKSSSATASNNDATISAENEPAYYKFGWQLVRGAQRERWLSAAQALGLPVDAGFRGFSRRGTARCRSIGGLEHAREAAASTVVLHHPVLLQSDEIIARLAQGLRMLDGLMDS